MNITRQPVRQKEPRPPRKLAYRMWIAKLPCVVCHKPDETQCAHVKIGWLCKQRRPSDYKTVPLCCRCHGIQHSGNEEAFWERVGIDPLKLAEALRGLYPDEMAAWTLVMNARRVCGG